MSQKFYKINPLFGGMDIVEYSIVNIDNGEYTLQSKEQYYSGDAKGYIYLKEIVPADSGTDGGYFRTKKACAENYATLVRKWADNIN